MGGIFTALIAPVGVQPGARVSPGNGPGLSGRPRHQRCTCSEQLFGMAGRLARSGVVFS